MSNTDTREALAADLADALRGAKHTIQSLINRLGGTEDFTDFDALLARAALATQPAQAMPSATPVAKKLVNDFARACLYGSDDERIAAGAALEKALASPTAQPVAVPAMTEAMVLAAARELCKIHAGQCQVDEQDTWNVYGEQFKDDARDALNAALAASPRPGHAGALTDDMIDDIASRGGAHWNGDVWKIEDADFYPLMRTFAAHGIAPKAAQPKEN